MSCDIANCDSNSENRVDSTDSEGNKTIYLHLKKFFRGTRYTFKPFLKSLQQKHKEADIVCVSGKVCFEGFSRVGWLFYALFFSLYSN